MILNGKTKDDFLKWKVNNKKLSTIEVLDFKHLSVITQNALIIEWFDSVRYNDIWSLWDYCFKSEYERLRISNSILNIQKQAIIKANEIYNDKK